MVIGICSDIGRKADELLYNDYRTNLNISLFALPFNGLTIIARGTRKLFERSQRDRFLSRTIDCQIKNKFGTLDISVDSYSNLKTVKHFELGVPGLTGTLSLRGFRQSPDWIHLQYLHDNVGLTTGFGMATNFPVFSITAVVGTKAMVVGGKLATNNRGVVFFHRLALGITRGNHSVAVRSGNNGMSLSSSYYYLINPLTSTSVGMSSLHFFSSNYNNVITLGTQHALSPLTMIKVRFDSKGNAFALIRHEWHSMVLSTITAKINMKDMTTKGLKVGFHLSLGYPHAHL